MQKVRTALLIAAAGLLALPASLSAQATGDMSGARVAREGRPDGGGRWQRPEGGQFRRPDMGGARLSPDGARWRGNERPGGFGGGDNPGRPSFRPDRPDRPDMPPRADGGDRFGRPDDAAPRFGTDRQRVDRQWNGRRDSPNRWDRDREIQRGGRDDRQWQARRLDDARRWNGDRRWDGDRRWGNDRRWNDGRRLGLRDDWRTDRRYDWRGWRDTHRDLYRHRYVAPRSWGYGYRPFGRGAYLQSFFYAPSYWLADPWAYRLPPVSGPYRWVRYYDDVLLVDVQSGEVVDVIQDFFW
ncbi:RcnB family protein [uncultured Sphingomonas sp.]|uniref:RcnB family protein n=1 Tax=uncultured Sphingomonas sp. TaxID=158754 RepID=UPI0025D36C68|nr:RcnB family protein [uncultured Sphingomonas sp.]